MAYVRKTETLIEDITRNVRNMKDRALQDYASNNIEVGSSLHDAAREAIDVAAYKDAPELRGKLPASWLKKKERMRLAIRVSDGMKLDVHVNARDDAPFLVPAHLDEGYYSSTVEVSRDDCNHVLKAWVDGEGDRAKQRQTIAEQYTNVERQLVAFMRQHASLNSAIKEMPEIEMYVPSQYMEKLREATAPRQKKPEQQSLVDEMQIDRDAIASIAIAHRLTTAAE